MAGFFEDFVSNYGLNAALNAFLRSGFRGARRRRQADLEASTRAEPTIVPYRGIRPDEFGSLRTLGFQPRAGMPLDEQLADTWAEPTIPEPPVPGPISTAPGVRGPIPVTPPIGLPDTPALARRRQYRQAYQQSPTVRQLASILLNPVKGTGPNPITPEEVQSMAQARLGGDYGYLGPKKQLRGGYASRDMGGSWSDGQGELSQTIAARDAAMQKAVWDKMRATRAQAARRDAATEAARQATLTPERMLHAQAAMGQTVVPDWARGSNPELFKQVQAERGMDLDSRQRAVRGKAVGRAMARSLRIGQPYFGSFGQTQGGGSDDEMGILRQALYSGNPYAIQGAVALANARQQGDYQRDMLGLKRDELQQRGKLAQSETEAQKRYREQMMELEDRRLAGQISAQQWQREATEEEARARRENEQWQREAAEEEARARRENEKWARSPEGTLTALYRNMSVSPYDIPQLRQDMGANNGSRGAGYRQSNVPQPLREILTQPGKDESAILDDIANAYPDLDSNPASRQAALAALREAKIDPSGLYDWARTHNRDAWGPLTKFFNRPGVFSMDVNPAGVATRRRNFQALKSLFPEWDILSPEYSTW